jgi:hypothetical protein
LVSFIGLSIIVFLGCGVFWFAYLTVLKNFLYPRFFYCFRLHMWWLSSLVFIVWFKMAHCFNHCRFLRTCICGFDLSVGLLNFGGGYFSLLTVVTNLWHGVTFFGFRCFFCLPCFFLANQNLIVFWLFSFHLMHGSKRICVCQFFPLFVVYLYCFISLSSHKCIYLGRFSLPLTTERQVTLGHYLPFD